ncbi:thiamine phosphate synthase [Corynebacterium sp. CCM 8835]|uniref:Thiamine-phosphate synthase n=1 Tax=Corynebacterium antarcticum TaxID=2800405 RepID=A0A9Q4CFT4_9CORY|nr:thiamine phosphate synthase [Corynebacterium antarcticum]MCK7643312.1 thiamine phosphate synthase [Corynebacterium antarcticum]MCK7661816.1 thiamine phosphate synthase [Corynebacterium antarcticum]MCL0246526.1 thiamine phosphate synthase [Corynebacterium antarcticum]MCX7492667.1 thiamine phosphate synthase [Corynebacterium antarcticum]MCX7538842.1 thiamine phosphate synthase [Corynebacterium antarcticum]
MKTIDESRLYLVTDARFRDDGTSGLLELAESACRAGVDIIQLRQKNPRIEAAEELDLLAALREVCDRYGTLLAVNDRADIARAAGADVLHLGQRDLPVATARQIVGPDVIIGRSCHDPGQVDAAIADPDVDYFCTGPVWATPTKPGRAATGLDLVRYAASTGTTRPWFAIGGIDPGNAGDVAAAGARRLVVVRAIADADDPAAATRALRTAVDGR